MAERKRAFNRSFAGLGIPVGTVLQYRNDASVTCKTADDKNGVSYQGKDYSLSALARELKGCTVSGYQYFRYNGSLLCDIGKESKASVAEADTVADPVVGMGDAKPEQPAFAGL